MPTPIKLTIYDAETHEAVKELSTCLVPWGVLKRAIRLVKILKFDLGKEDKEGRVEELLEHLDDEGFDTLTELVADVFHGKVTTDELQWGTDATEMLTVLMGVVNRAFGEFSKGALGPLKPGKK